MNRYSKILIILGSLVLLCGLLLLIPFADRSMWSEVLSWCRRFGDREWVAQLLHSVGWAAPVVFVLIQFGQVVLAPIPGDVTGFIGGYLFGGVGGFGLSTLGLTLGSMMAFYIGRFLGEPVVRRIVTADTYSKYNDIFQRKGLLPTFIMFLIPGFPKDYLCFLLGLTSVPTRMFFLLSTIGRMPGTLALSLEGAWLFNKNYSVLVFTAGICVVLALIAFLMRAALNRWIAGGINSVRTAQ